MQSKLTATDLQIIACSPVFCGLLPGLVDEVVAPATAVSLRRQEPIVRQGDPASAFYIVIDGWVKLYRNSASGDESIIEIMSQGGSFGEVDALTGQTYFFGADAASDVRLAWIPAGHVIRGIAARPELALSLMRSISQHVHYLVQQVEQLKAQSVVQRVAEFLVSLSPEKEGPCTLALPYGKVLIAGQLGLMPESLSRAFARLRSIGVEVGAGRVAVNDMAKLRQLAADSRNAVRATLQP
ncbi:MAG: Crp/Fnr family transcriptional regulator [Alphaproteobacteria bacterium]|nr:Crp/Fnr family transcriptional regulator [Alphaproteobacteria bacterium]MDE2011365.1 Crp/Fnr family transcriptional regulator [Alphaproteobacteria bacterium]MDE2072885.1 Crp/Fnr family transcriptional regulator [Alphaproteobacteria bacterium]MDE2353305.1 Crp/Fnr family transcriptional regulator [Alphaproteobacteria bacterium]